MNDRTWYEIASEALARDGRKKPRRRKMRVIQLPDDPRIGRKRKARHSLADRAPVRGDRIGTGSDAIWLNVGREAGESAADVARRREGR